MYTQNGKAKAQNNITKAAKINTVFKPCMNKVASLLIGRKVTFQQQVNKGQGCITIGKEQQISKVGNWQIHGEKLLLLTG